MKNKKKNFSFLHQYVATVLIFLIFISQTIHISFFEKTEAAISEYRDIVSVIVDEQSYNELRGKIRTYANDIQGYLKSTRVTIYVVPTNARPEIIMAHNEKLFYEGDGKPGISQLVGTVLIGNVPIPIVHKDGLSFPSLYPYVDFQNKRFLYDETKKRFNFSKESHEGADVDIWHGVINPSLGSEWSSTVDIQKIEQFLDKTHEFYTRSGKFSPTTLPPRVFYYDGYAESLSTDERSMYKYVLFTQNAENVEYKRWGKYLLGDIISSLSQFQNAHSGSEDAYASSLLGTGVTLGDESIDPSVLATMPDIQTATPIMSYLKRFHETINKKTLSDIQEYVHNAGRYNSGNIVRVDQGAIQISITDQVSMDILKAANDAIESSIDAILTGSNYARRIPILDSIWAQSPLLANMVGATPASIAANPLVEYKNYYFGRKAETITRPEQCSIARGWSGFSDLFKRPVLVESNVMYNINSTQEHLGYLSGDTDDMVSLWRNARYACFTPEGSPKIESYFGSNSLLSIMTTRKDPVAYFQETPSGTSLKGFSKSIFDLAGMKETKRLPNPSLNDCIGNRFQYNLLEPHNFTYDIVDTWSYAGGTYSCKGAFPLEWSTSNSYCSNLALTDNPRFTCNTEHMSYPGDHSIEGALATYNSNCYYGTVLIDGKYYKSDGSLSLGQANLGNRCIIYGNAYSGEPDVDTTIYQNRVYHTIPSLLKHVSPTSEELLAAKTNGMTPSIPVNTVRTVEFLTAKGGIARLTYPNFFEAPTSSIADVRAWLKTLSDTEWNTIISSENLRNQSSNDRNLSSSLGARSIPNAPIDWNTLVSDDVIGKVIRAKRSLAPNVTNKYQNLLEASLSYSHSSSGDILDNPLPLPKLSDGYEIAYLGLTPFVPKGESAGEDTTLQGYQYQLGEIQGLNFAEEDPALNDPDPAIRTQAECGPPDGVPLFQWPSSIQCWIKSLFPVKIMAGSCSSNTIGIDKSSQSVTSPPIDISSDSAELRTYYTSARILYSVERIMMQPGGNLEVKYILDKDGSIVELPPDAKIDLKITGISSEGQSIPESQFRDYATLSAETATYTNEGASFLVQSKGPFADITLVPKLTLPLPDGTKYEAVGSPLTLKVRDEYVDILPKKGDEPVSTITTTETGSITLSFQPKRGTGINVANTPPYKLDIYDDVSSTLIESGVTINSDSFTLPETYKEKIGVYRFVVSDVSGRAGEVTLAVRSGPLSRMEFIPVSSSMVTGKPSVGVLRLFDAKGNLISPTLSHITATVTNGSLLDANSRELGTISMDSTESEVLFRYTAGSIGNMGLEFSVTDPNIVVASNIRVIDTPRIYIIRSTAPRVGSDPITVDIELRDPVSNTPISGFSSVASLDIPPGAGSFNKTVVNITDGRAEQVLFTPGKIAGEHIFLIEIAGVGDATEKKFNILPGVPMYVDGNITNTNIEFTLRDRYGNLSPESPSGNLKFNQDIPVNINFLEGKYYMPRTPGYWKVEVPSIRLNTITYLDYQSGSTDVNATGTVTKTIAGIPYYQIYVPDIGRKFGFRPDYNARYTVLAGDSYLTEGSQILYETAPGQSQSLAVSTILSSPYEKETLFSLYPGGGLSIGSTSDTAIEAMVRNRGDNLHLEAYDAAAQTPIAKVAYPLKNLNIFTCTDSTSLSKKCSLFGAQGAIMFVEFSDGEGITQSGGNQAKLTVNNIDKVVYTKNSGLVLSAGVVLKPLLEDSLSSLVLSVEENGTIIGKIILHADEVVGVDISDTNAPVNALTLDERFSYSLEATYSDIFSPLKKGYSLVRNPSSQIIDHRIVGPSRIESFGSLLDVPGIGWEGNNRTLLSYAAGDTVGEATKWYHTFTLVNLGDPVAHVDKPNTSQGIEAPPETELEGVDRTIGTQIASSSDKMIRSYKKKDMNGDGLDDIIVVYNDGFIELFLNMGGKFRKKEKIAYIPYITPLGIEFGDFMGDDYADIIGLDRSGSLALIDNNTRKLKETLIKVFGDSPPNGVTQFKVYDMDNDTRDDIVYLTENGEMGVLYGTNLAGTFEKKILESDLGVTISSLPEKGGGAIRASVTPESILSNPVGTGAVDESILNTEVFYIFQSIEGGSPTSDDDIEGIENSLSGSFNDPNSESVGTGSLVSGLTYVRSEYAGAYGLDVEKRIRNLSQATLHGGDRIQVEITITNSGAQIARNISYLDTIAKIFEFPEDAKYKIRLGATNQEKEFQPISGEDYDILLQGVDIPPGQALTLSYELTALSTSYGKMIVDNLEKNLTGDDAFGDVGFETSNTCGADMVVWNSTAVRSYQRGVRTFTAADLPPGLADQLADENNNGIPDSIEFSSGGIIGTGSQNSLTNTYNSMVDEKHGGNSNILNVNVNNGGQLATIGFNPNVERQMETMMQNLADGLSCGFGGGGCLSSPINWAPLAPGNAISVLGNSIGRDPAVNQGIPIFAALTRMDIGVTPYCFTFPVIWPISPLSLNASLPCSSTNVATAWAEAIAQMPSAFMGVSSASSNIGAGGVLGVDSSSNFLRIFVTPTLTMAMGTAICMGPARTNGPNPMYPLVSKGNCIIMTKSMPVCKGDGSRGDGDVTGISGLGTSSDAWNSQSCTMQAATSLTPLEEKNMTQSILDYLKNPDTSRLNSIYKNISTRGGRSKNLGGPSIRLGNPGNSGTAINIDIDSSKPLEIGNIVKINNKKIAGFPEYIMDWVGRQTEELTNKLFTLPNLIIYTPKSFGPNTSGNLSELTNYFSEASIKQGFNELKGKLGEAQNVNVTNSFNRRTTGKTGASSTYDKWLDSTVSENSSTINTVAGGANQWRQAWKLIAQIPFVKIEQVSIPINIPWLLPQDLDRYARSLKQYENEWKRAETSWCAGKTAQECIDIKTSMNTSGAQSTIKKTLKRIEEWRRFPEKLQKYITWKQRYVAQVLCNIDVLERMIGGWYRDNGIRFKKWAEFYVLVRTIAETWQPFLDLWRDKDRSCSVCQNQRWDLKFWKFKMLSAVIPQIPILQFPRWPDIVLDLSDIRFGVLFRVPDFRFNISPIRLPNLPSLGLPSMPTAGAKFGFNFDIPAPPSLPNLPDLPSLPKIRLPNLPSPPKLPKIFGAVSAGIKIFKLYTKIQCYMEKTLLVPEDYAGATIAQRTDRQGTLPFDFINVRLPQIALGAWPREIRVSTHVNFQIKSDFIVEFAKAAVKPINSFSTDFSKIPKKIGNDINIQGPGNQSLNIQGAIKDHDYEQVVTLLTNELEQQRGDSDERISVEEFIPYLRSELLVAGLDVGKFDRSILKARREAEGITKKFEDQNKEGFRLLREYLHAEEAETKEYEKLIDRMKKDDSYLGEENIPMAHFVNASPSQAENALRRYNVFQEARVEGGDSLDQSGDIGDAMQSLKSRMSRLLAQGGGSDTSSSSTAAGYSPKFEGIYILSPLTKTQTRLFDYTSLLRGGEEVDVTDIDEDGDQDYIYMLGGALYIKYNHLREPNSIIDDTLTTENIDSTVSPEAPNFFREKISSPGEINLSFRRANPLDTSFRLEFFNKYLEWDRVGLAGSDYPDTPRTIIDLTVVNDPQSTITTSDYSESRVTRSLESAQVSSGFVLEGMKVTTLQGDQPFGLSTGRPIYTGNSPAILSVRIIGTDEQKEYPLERFKRYVFPNTLSGSLISGKAYILTPSGTEKISYTPEMNGIPLLEDTRIVDNQNPFSIYNPIENISTEIPSGTEYRHIGLTSINDNYSINFPFENGYYSARLRSLRSGNVIRAGVTLLAPLAALDRSPPVIELTDEKIPVYQTKTFPLTDVISELNTFSLLADPDITVDTDANGNYADDYVASSTGIQINDSNITFGQYETLGLRFMNLRAVDAFGNKKTSPLRVEVYAPVPKILSVSTGGVLSGSLDEEIRNEPIHLFRVRPGDGVVLMDQNPIFTQAEGKFGTGNLFHSGAPISVIGDSMTISLSSKTGLPLGSANIVSEVFPANATSPVRVRYKDANTNAPLFQVSIIPPANLQIIGPSTAGSGSGGFLKIEALSLSEVIPASLSDPNIPGGKYITTNASPLIAVDRHGQIYLSDATAQLRMTEENGYLIIYASKGGVDVAKLSYMIDFYVAGK